MAKRDKFVHTIPAADMRTTTPQENVQAVRDTGCSASAKVNADGSCTITTTGATEKVAYWKRMLG